MERRLMPGRSVVHKKTKKSEAASARPPSFFFRGSVDNEEEERDRSCSLILSLLDTNSTLNNKARFFFALAFFVSL